MLGAALKAGETAEYRMGTQRHAYLVPAVGKIEVNGVVAKTRDGVALTNEPVVTVKAIEDAEVVLVDSP